MLIVLRLKVEARSGDEGAAVFVLAWVEEK